MESQLFFGQNALSLLLLRRQFKCGVHLSFLLDTENHKATPSFNLCKRDAAISQSMGRGTSVLKPPFYDLV